MIARGQGHAAAGFFQGEIVAAQNPAREKDVVKKRVPGLVHRREPLVDRDAEPRETVAYRAEKLRVGPLAL